MYLIYCACSEEFLLSKTNIAYIMCEANTKFVIAIFFISDPIKLAFVKILLLQKIVPDLIC